MSDFRPAEVIEVRAWGRTVGAVAPDPASGYFAFEYDPAWIREGVELAPLHLPSRPGVFTFPGLSPETYQRLPPMLADSLPDRFGNALIDAWMASRGVTPDQVSALDRLAYTADRAMGALSFAPPSGTPPGEVSALALADLVAAARSAVRGELVDGPEGEAALHQLLQVGTSAGGARPKAVIAYDPVTHRIRSGQLAAPPGFEHWLVKLDGVGADPSREDQGLGDGGGYGVVEYAYHLMAVAAGLDMAECALLAEGPRRHFLTRRFDRTSTDERVHVLTLCGLAHLDFNQAGAHGYEQYLQTIEVLGLDADARHQAFRRVVFNVAAVNCDDHTKNLGFVLPEGGDWALAPAYDVTFAYNPRGRWTSGHQMTVAGRRDGISRQDLTELGDRFAVPGYRRAIGEVLGAVDRWPTFAEEAGLDAGRRDAISAAHLAHRP